MEKTNVLSLCIENNLISASFFDGCRVFLFTPFLDTYRFELTNNLIDSFSPASIAVNTIIGIGPILKKDNIKKFNKIVVGHKKRVFIDLSRGENMCLKALCSFCSHSTLVAVENTKIIGYSGTYPIERKSWKSFYIGNTYKTISKRSTKIGDLLKKTKTSYGKTTLSRWIQQPLTTSTEILDRRKQAHFIAKELPKVTKLLKCCRILKVEATTNFSKLKTALKAVFNLQKLVSPILQLNNHKRYLKLYKILKAIENRSKDNDSEENAVIDQLSKYLAEKYAIALCIVYFPHLGYLIESIIPIKKAIFKIKDKYYCKNKEMIDLDLQMGDSYNKKSKQETKTQIKLLKHIRKANYSYLYDFIGNVDALCSLASSCGTYATVNHDNICKINGVSLSIKNIVPSYMDGLNLIETIALNQIGCKVCSIDTILTTYKSIAFFTQNSCCFDLKNSYFQKEAMEMGIIIRNSTVDTFCVIENPFQSTSPTVGFLIFSAFKKKILAKNLILSTAFNINNTSAIDQEKLLGYDKNTQLLTEATQYWREEQKNEERSLFSVNSKWVLLENKNYHIDK